MQLNSDLSARWWRRIPLVPSCKQARCEGVDIFRDTEMARSVGLCCETARPDHNVNRIQSQNGHYISRRQRGAAAINLKRNFLNLVEV